MLSTALSHADPSSTREGSATLTQRQVTLQSLLGSQGHNTHASSCGQEQSLARKSLRVTIKSHHSPNCHPSMENQWIEEMNSFLLQPELITLSLGCFVNGIITLESSALSQYLSSQNVAIKNSRVSLRKCTEYKLSRTRCRSAGAWPEAGTQSHVENGSHSFQLFLLTCL